MENNNGNNNAGEDRKSQIHEMLDNIHEIETRNVNDGSELLREEISEGEKERILSRVMAKITNENMENDQISRNINRNHKNKKRKILVAAAAAVFIFASTAVAAEVFEWDNRISAYLGINSENSVQLDGSGMNPNVSTERNGVTIKAVQTLGDANNIYVLLDVVAPEGVKLGINSRFDWPKVSVGNALDGPTGMGYSCDFLPDGSEDDNKATMLFSMEANKDINDKTIKLSFNDLMHYVPESGEYATDVKGSWELEWKLDYKDNSVKYRVNREIAVNGEVVKVDAVEISPIAINIKASGKYIREYDSTPPDPSKGELMAIKAVTLKDGTVLTPENDSFGWGSSIDGDKYTMNMRLKELIDHEQVKSITLNDTVIPIE